MNCPYCAETIKHEALVCPHCRRDLSFFKPIERRLRTVEQKLDVLVSETSQIMDSLQRMQSTQKTGDIIVGAVMKPSFSRIAIVVLIHIVLTAGCLGLYSAIHDAVRPSFEYYAPSLSSVDELNLFDREYEVFLRRQRTILVLFLPVFFVIPIAVGFWIGLRWRGKHFKRYLLIGVTCGAIEGVLFCLLIFIADRNIRSEDVYFLLLFLGIILGINIARCTFGFISGGLIGDWIERSDLQKDMR